MDKLLIIATFIYVLADLALVRGREKHRGLELTALMYASLLFVIYPLVISPTEGYFNVGDFRFKFYVVFTGGVMASAIILLVRSKISVQELGKLRTLDLAALLYLFFSLTAFLFSGDFRASFFGSEAWRTGFLFQHVIVLIYLFISRFSEHSRLWLRAVLLSGCIIFALGVLHRFSVDPLGLYRGVEPLGQIRFLSTIGQATRYSSYLCLVFPLGIYLFTVAKEPLDMALSSAFIVLASMSLVTQNSDSAYIAMFLEFVLITFLYLFCKRDIGRLSYIYMMISLSVLVTGLLEKSFSQQFAKIDPLSVWVAQGPLPYAGIVFSGLLYFFSRIIDSKDREFAKKSAWSFLIICTALLGAGIMIALRGSFGMEGALSEYADFGLDWGNGRGLILKRTFEMYHDLPVWRKIIGIGPGVFSHYLGRYTELELDNAHNEWLTVFIESGIGAGLAYLAIFVVSIVDSARAAVRSMDQEKALYLIALSAAVIGYVGHGVFCYQQALTTPMIFVLMGMASNIKEKCQR